MIGNLAVGDIFRAESDTDMELICLVTAVTGDWIRARTLTHQLLVDIDRKTGKGICNWPGYVRECSINSVAPLPNDVHDTLLGLDRKMRLELNPDNLTLSPAETRALLFLDKHYADKRI